MLVQPGHGWLSNGHPYYTVLAHLTEETLHEDIGEIVMVDAIPELIRHLSFVLCARGKVLVTGLGLGCVVRGLIHVGKVREITVVERSLTLIKMVQPWLPECVHLVHAEALDFAMKTTKRFDWAWHDLWCDPDKGELDLAGLHVEMMMALVGKVHRQDAWGLPSTYRKILRTVRRQSKHKKGF